MEWFGIIMIIWLYKHSQGIFSSFFYFAKLVLQDYWSIKILMSLITYTPLAEKKLAKNSKFKIKELITLFQIKFSENFSYCALHCFSVHPGLSTPAYQTASSTDQTLQLYRGCIQKCWLQKWGSRNPLYILRISVHSHGSDSTVFSDD